MNWKRTVAWSTLIYAATLIMGLSLGAGYVSMMGVFMSSSILYCLFVRPLPQGRLGHAIAAFILVETTDWGIPLLLGASVSHMLENWASSACHLGAALSGFTVAWLSQRRVQ